MVRQAVYLVWVRVAPGQPDGPNAEVLQVKLTRSSADALARQVPGSWVEKMMADKD